MAAQQSKDGLSRHASAAKDLKKWLRQAFPGVKFSVRSDCFAGGTSVHVSWHFGPTTKAVEEWANDYKDGTFDGMVDLYEYDRSEAGEAFRKRHGGAKYVQCHRDYTPAGGDWQDEVTLFERVARDLCALQRIEYRNMSQRDLLGDADRFTLQNRVHTLFARTTFEPGKDYGGVEYTPAEAQETGHDWCRVVQVDAGKGTAL